MKPLRIPVSSYERKSPRYSPEFIAKTRQLIAEVKADREMMFQIALFTMACDLEQIVEDECGITPPNGRKCRLSGAQSQTRAAAWA